MLQEVLLDADAVLSAANLETDLDHLEHDAGQSGAQQRQSPAEHKQPDLGAQT